MAKKVLAVCAMVFQTLTAVSWAASSGGYNSISAAELQRRLDAKKPMIQVDICTAGRFAKGHIPGSIEINAQPAETDEQRARPANVLPKIQASKHDVIIVCPRGGGGAKKTVDFYRSPGVEEKRLILLEKGVDARPYAAGKR